MKKSLFGIVLGFLIGVFCCVLNIPLPAPPLITGALLVLSMTVGYLIGGALSNKKSNTTEHLCAGPTGKGLHDKNQGDS